MEDFTQVKAMCFSAVQKYFDTEEFQAIKRLNSNLAKAMINATVDEIAFGETPRFQRYDFTGIISSGVM